MKEIWYFSVDSSIIREILHLSISFHVKSTIFSETISKKFLFEFFLFENVLLFLVALFDCNINELCAPEVQSVIIKPRLLLIPSVWNTVHSLATSEKACSCRGGQKLNVTCFGFFCSLSHSNVPMGRACSALKR